MATRAEIDPVQNTETGSTYRLLRPRGDRPDGADGTRVVTASDDKTARLWRVFPTTQALVDHAKRTVPRCLSQAQLRELYLPEEPPRWCITGAGLAAERDPQKWQPLWPYHTRAWRDWLAARDRGENPELPKE